MNTQLPTTTTTNCGANMHHHHPKANKKYDILTKDIHYEQIVIIHARARSVDVCNRS